MDANALQLVSDSIPSASLNREIVIGSLVVDVMTASGLLESKGAAKRMIRNGGIRINNIKVTDESQIIVSSDVIGDDMILLAAGKKNKLLLRLE